MSYTPIYNKPYPDGWKDLPSEETPVTAEILDAYDDAFEHIEEALEDSITAEGGTITGSLSFGEDERNYIDDEEIFFADDNDGLTRVRGGSILVANENGQIDNSIDKFGVSSYKTDPDSGTRVQSALTPHEITENNQALYERYAGYKSAYGENSGSVNIFDGKNVLENKNLNSNGIPESVQGFSTSDFISLVPFENMILFASDNSNSGRHYFTIAFYDRNKNYLGNTASTTGNIRWFGVWDEHEDAYYIRFSNYSENIEKTVITDRDMTDYVPYLRYSTKMLCDKVDVLDNVLDNAGLMPLSVTWESGRFDGSGNPIPQDNNARTVEFIPLNYGETITCDLGASYIWFHMEYNASKVGLGSFTVHNSAKTFTYTPSNPACKYVRFVAVTTPDKLNGIATFSKPNVLDKIPVLESEVSNINDTLTNLEYGDTHGGSNLWDETWENGEIDTNSGNNVANANRIRTKGFIPVKPNTTYFIYVGSTTTNGVRCYEYNKDKTYTTIRALKNNNTLVTGANTYYLRFHAFDDYGSSYKHDIAIIESSTAKPYEPYIPSVKMLSEEVDSVNSNLYELEYSNVAGGKNLLNPNNWRIGYDWNNQGTGNKSNRAVYIINHTDYIGKSLNISSNSSDLTFARLVYNTTSASGLVSNPLNITSNVTFVCVEVETNKSIMTQSIIDSAKIQLEIGTTATAYEPWIMSNKQLTDVNASLDEYGLVNKFGGYSQGYRLNNYNIQTDGSFVCNANEITCNSGDVVRLKSNGNKIYLAFYDSSKTQVNASTTISGNDEISSVAPSNAKYISFAIQKSGITPSNAPKIYVSVGSAIDEIKADLSNLIEVKTISLNATANADTDATVSWDKTPTVAFVTNVQGMSTNTKVTFANFINKSNNQLRVVSTIAQTVNVTVCALHL